MLSGRLQSGFRQIDTGVNGAMAGKHDSVRPVAGADLEDVFSLPVRKRDQEREVPFGAKSVFAQLLKKISFVRVFFNEMKAAGLGIPGIPRPAAFISLKNTRTKEIFLSNCANTDFAPNGTSRSWSRLRTGREKTSSRSAPATGRTESCLPAMAPFTPVSI